MLSLPTDGAECLHSPCALLETPNFTRVVTHKREGYEIGPAQVPKDLGQYARALCMVAYALLLLEHVLSSEHSLAPGPTDHLASAGGHVPVLNGETIITDAVAEVPSDFRAIQLPQKPFSAVPENLVDGVDTYCQRSLDDFPCLARRHFVRHVVLERTMAVIGYLGQNIALQLFEWQLIVPEGH